MEFVSDKAVLGELLNNGSITGIMGGNREHWRKGGSESSCVKFIMLLEGN